MKGLVLAACVGSAAAVVAPQFPNNAFYQVGGGCGCVVERPYSVCVATGPGSNYPYFFTTPAISVPADFVVTDIVVGVDEAITSYSFNISDCVRVLANGVVVCTTQATHVSANTTGGGFRSMTSGAKFQHGVVIPAGHQITVQSTGTRVYVTLSGYLK